MTTEFTSAVTTIAAYCFGRSVKNFVNDILYARKVNKSQKRCERK